MEVFFLEFNYISVRIEIWMESFLLPLTMSSSATIKTAKIEIKTTTTSLAKKAVEKFMPLKTEWISLIAILLSLLLSYTFSSILVICLFCFFITKHIIGICNNHKFLFRLLFLFFVLVFIWVIFRRKLFESFLNLFLCCISFDPKHLIIVLRLRIASSSRI